MSDEIMQELWQHKDHIALEQEYDIEALVAHLRGKKRPDGQQVVDLHAMTEADERVAPACSRTSRG